MKIVMTNLIKKPKKWPLPAKEVYSLVFKTVKSYDRFPKDRAITIEDVAQEITLFLLLYLDEEKLNSISNLQAYINIVSRRRAMKLLFYPFNRIQVVALEEYHFYGFSVPTVETFTTDDSVLNEKIDLLVREKLTSREMKAIRLVFWEEKRLADVIRKNGARYHNYYYRAISRLRQYSHLLTG